MATVTKALAKSRLEWSDMGPRIWFLACSPAVAELQNRVHPAAAIAITRKKKDIVLLPGGSEATREFVDFCRNLLGLDEGQISYTEDSGEFLLESNNSGAFGNIEAVLQGTHEGGEAFMLIPYKITASIKKWLPPLQDKGLLLFGDASPSWKRASSAILHRHTKSLEEPSLIEELLPEISMPKGYVCTTVEELVRAFAKLEEDLGNDRWRNEALLRPLKSFGNSGVLLIKSGEELRHYDFPQGPVILEEVISQDRVQDTVFISFLLNEQLQPMSLIQAPNGIPMGIHNCRASEEHLRTCQGWAARILKETRIGASGVGALEFAIVNGNPILMNIATGFHTEHIPLVFAHMYAKDSRICSWQFTPAENLDVWTFWYRLYDAGLTFRPGKKSSTSGVFPLNFQKGSRSLFIAVGPTDAAVDDLCRRAEAILREPFVEQPLERVGLADDVRRIWCGSARPEYRRETQRYNLPNRCLCLVRKDKDFIILPGNHKSVREYWELVKEVMGLSDDQVLWTSNEHFVMDDDVNEEIIRRIKGIVTSSPKDKFTIIPYCVTRNFERWSGQLKEIGVTVFGEENEWVNKYGHKGILHRHVRALDQPCIIEGIVPNVRVAKGYTCDTPDDLLSAYDLIGCPSVVIKPVFGAAGEGIIFVSDKEFLKRYDFPMGQVVLEEHLDLDRTADGIVLSPAVHYLGGTLFGKMMVDQIMVGTGYAGWRRSQAPKEFQETCCRAVKKILKGIAPKGPGGFDFLSVEGVPFLTDINTGRFNGAHYPKLFQELHAPECTFHCFKHKPPATLTAQQFYHRLQSADIAFAPGKSTSGVFPMVYMRGLSGLYICIGKTDEECVALAQQAKMCLAERAPLSRPASVSTDATPSTSVELTLIKNAEAIYAPDIVPQSAVLIAGGKIVALLNAEDSDRYEGLLLATRGKVIDAQGLVLVPGLIDPHVHVTGGGGEMGPASRTPELQVSQIVSAGITTVVGICGTDTISRSQENILTKCRALQAEGITAYMWAGGYRVPTPTLAGNIQRDICLIEQCIGVGEIAVSDHRGSQPTSHDLAVMASECVVGGMLAGKAGVVHVHLGRGTRLLNDLRAAVRESDVPITAFYPTHVSRTRELAEDAGKWVKEGGHVDLTAQSSMTVPTLARYFASGVSLDHVTVSTDAGGSCPSFDDKGNLVHYCAMKPDSLLELIKRLYFDLQWPLQRILPLMTRNTANILKFPCKGTLEVGKDADILLLDTETLGVRYVFAHGKMMLGPDFLFKGMFEA